MITANMYEIETEVWRSEAEATLRANDGWLTVVGLFWLVEGKNSVGSAETNAVQLPDGFPSLVGSFHLEDRRVTFVPADEIEVELNGVPLREPKQLRYSKNKPDLLTLDHVTLFVIERGDRVGVRMRDTKSAARKAFTGRIWFPIDEEFRIEGEFIPYDPPKRLAITNVLGDIEESNSPGYVRFELGGQAYTLDVSSQSNRGLFIVFRDTTAGKETYPAARFLYVPLPIDNRVVVDFNRAVSPPCAFTDFATCPLPLPQNRLPIAIIAGERYVGY